MTQPSAVRASLLAAPIAFMIGLLFHDVVGYLLIQYSRNPDLSYGVFVLPLAGWVIYQRRSELAAAPRRPDNRGLILTALACLAFLAGRLSAELYSSRGSLILLLAGLVWTFWGLAALRLLAGRGTLYWPDAGLFVPRRMSRTRSTWLCTPSLA